MIFNLLHIIIAIVIAFIHEEIIITIPNMPVVFATICHLILAVKLFFVPELFLLDT